MLRRKLRRVRTGRFRKVTLRAGDREDLGTVAQLGTPAADDRRRVARRQSFTSDWRAGTVALLHDTAASAAPHMEENDRCFIGFLCFRLFTYKCRQIAHDAHGASAGDYL